MNNNTTENSKVVAFSNKEAEEKENSVDVCIEENTNEVPREQIKVIDGWSTNVNSVVEQSIYDDIEKVYRLKKTNRIVIPFNKKSCSTVHYQFETLFGIVIDYYLDILFETDENYRECTVMWLSDTTEERIKSILKYINWNKILSSGGSVTGISDRKHVMSFSADAENNTELVEMYVEAAISVINNEMCAIDINLYAKLTEEGKKFLYSEE